MDACARAGFDEPLNDMSDLSDFSKTSPQLETVDVEMHFDREIGRVYPDGSRVVTGQ